MKTDNQLRTAVLSVSDGIVTVTLAFKNKTTADWSGTFVCTRALASLLREGDLVVADTQFGPRVAIVEEIHDEPEFHTDEINWRWVVQKVDISVVEALEAKVQAGVKALKVAQRQYLKRQVAQQLGISAEDARLIVPDFNVIDETKG